jgi:hypothetical protein
MISYRRLTLGLGSRTCLDEIMHVFKIGRPPIPSLLDSSDHGLTLVVSSFSGMYA